MKSTLQTQAVIVTVVVDTLRETISQIKNVSSSDYYSKISLQVSLLTLLRIIEAAQSKAALTNDEMKKITLLLQPLKSIPWLTVKEVQEILSRLC